ncbi:hypothetical protein GTCCBUS3UF5_34350 [Geobacillus thermoleovorans CCB_US3_UF5]|uniref:Lipoprotein n=1 Tax=Geobacillus thermoleovorans CCB_US3_UF5 TaxID=1111068 RepID=A0ABN4A248_GEOTH|nr:hypothetical protein GTCCBUS3UF5_34350 [Geobacillus thermoleovorans CCB_US3_UF5]
MARAFVRVSFFFACALASCRPARNGGGWRLSAGSGMLGPRGFCRREADGFQRFEGGAA